MPKKRNPITISIHRIRTGKPVRKKRTVRTAKNQKSNHHQFIDLPGIKSLRDRIPENDGHRPGAGENPYAVNHQSQCKKVGVKAKPDHEFLYISP